MTNTPIPLATCWNNKLDSWTVIHIGEGKRWTPPAGSKWSHWDAIQTLRGVRAERGEVMG